MMMRSKTKLKKKWCCKRSDRLGEITVIILRAKKNLKYGKTQEEAKVKGIMSKGHEYTTSINLKNGISQ